MHRPLPVCTLILLFCCADTYASDLSYPSTDLPWTWRPHVCTTCTPYTAPHVPSASLHTDAFVQHYVFADPILGASEHLWSPIATSGDTLVMTSFGDVGGVHVFVRSGDQWTEQALLLPTNGQFELTATSAAINGDTLVIGQAGRTGTTGYPLAGGVSVFVRNASMWTLQGDLQLDDGIDGDFFGLSVAIDGDTLVAGRPRTQSQASGDAHVFVRQGTTWTHQATLTANEPQLATAFGYSVAISGDTILAGEPGHSHTSGDTSWEGAAYAFVRVGESWTQQARFEGSVPFDQMGYCVDLDGNIAVADIIGETGAGGVYIYRRDASEWISPPAFLTNPDPDLAPYFGLSVAIDDSTVIVGHFNGSTMEVPISGTVYVYGLSGDTWLQQEQLQDDTPETNNHFGERIAFDNGTILVWEPAGVGIAWLHVFINDDVFSNGFD